MDPEVAASSGWSSESEEIKLGMILVGLILSSMLYGITLSQTLTYIKRFPSDPRTIKSMVLAITVMDTVSAVFVAHTSWYYMVSREDSRWSVWSFDAELALSMAISGLAEGFLTWRVWMLSGQKKILTLVLLSLAVTHLISGEVCAARFFQLRSWNQFNSVKAPSILRLVSAALCDTGIAISLCYFLQQKRTGYRRTDEIINHLIVFSLNTGLVLSISSVACLVTYLVIPKTWTYMSLCFLISRLYANTFLCSLNTRQILQHSVDMESPIVPQFNSMAARRQMATKTPTQIDISVVTEVASDSDVPSTKSTEKSEDRTLHQSRSTHTRHRPVTSIEETASESDAFSSTSDVQKF